MTHAERRETHKERERTFHAQRECVWRREEQGKVEELAVATWTDGTSIGRVDGLLFSARDDD